MTVETLMGRLVLNSTTCGSQMSYTKPLFALYVAALILGSPPASYALGQETARKSKRPTVEQLRQLLTRRSSRVTLDKALTAYPKLKGTQGTLAFELNGKTEVTESSVSTRIVDADYLLLEYGIADDKVVHELITYVQVDGLYRRWQFIEEQLIVEWVGIGSANASGPARNRYRTNTVSWTPVSSDQSKLAKSDCICTDTVTLDTLTGDTKLVRSTATILDGQLQSRETMTVRSSLGNLSTFEEPYERLQASKKESKGSLWERLTGKKKGGEYRFKKENFVFRPTESGFVKVDYSRINPAVTLGLRHGRRNQHLIVVAENAETVSATAAAYSDLIRQMAESALPGTKLTAASTQEVNGVQFSTFAAIVMEPRKVTRVYSTAKFGDHFYQVVTTTPDRTLAASEAFHLKALNGFTIIDRTRAEDPFLVLDKQHYGLRTNPDKLRKLRAQKGFDVTAAETEAILSLQFDDDGTLDVWGLDLEGIDIEDDEALAILTAEIGLDYPDTVVSSRPIRTGTAVGTEVTFVTEFVSGKDGTYIVRLLRNDERLVMLAATTEATTAKRQANLRERLDTVEFYKPKRQPRRPDSEKNAALVNVLGVQLFKMGQVETGLALVKLAGRRRPKNELMASNVVGILQRSGDFEGALEQVEKSLKVFPRSQNLLVAKADALDSLRRYNESLAVYEQLLKFDTFTESDLYGYANTLLQVGRADDAVTAYETHLSRLKQPSVAVRRGYCSVLQVAEKFDEAVQLAKKLQQEMPNNVELKEDLIHAYVEAGQAPDALIEIEKLVSAGQATANCMYLQGRAYLIERRYGKAKKAFEAGLRIAPGDPTLQDAILAASAAMGEGDNSSIKEPLDPVAIPEIVAQKMASLPEFQSDDGFNYQLIEQTTGLEFRTDEPIRKTEYREYLIHNQAGVDSLQKLRFAFDPTYERIYVNELKVIDAAGNVTDQRKESQFYLTSAGSYGMATTEKYLNVSVSGLKPGHRLRYVFTKSDRRPGDSIPFTSRLFLATAPGGPGCLFVTGDIENLVSDQTDSAIQSVTDVRTKAWVLPKTPLLRIESLQPEGLDFVPRVWFGSNHDSWKAIGERYLERIRQPLEQTPEASRLAKSLVPAESSDEQKARTILRWIQDQMAYQALEFGVHAQIPATAPSTLRNRFGDCKDLSLLGLQMLRALGVRSHMCLINASGELEKAAPDLSQFNHAILFLPDINGGVFVDCTSRFIDPLRSGSAVLFGKEGLVLDPANIRFQPILVDKANQTRLDSRRTITLAADNSDALVTETLTVEGSYARSLRSFLLETNEAEIKKYLTQLLTDKKRVDVVSYKARNAEDFLKPLVLELTYRIRKVVKVLGTKRKVEVPGRWEEYVLREVVVSERLTPFELATSLRFTTSLDIRVPSGWQCDSTASPESESSEWLDCKIEPSWQSGNMVLKSRITKKAGTFPAESFGDFQDSMNRAVDAVTPELTFSVSTP